MHKLPISDATDQQIAAFATNVQGLDVSSVTPAGRGAVLGLLGQTWPFDYILLDEAQAGAPAADQVEVITAPSGQSMGGIGKDDPIVKLRIGQTEQPGGKDPVPVSVNGRTVVIQRGPVADVPYRYYLALLASERVVVEQNLSVPFGHPDYGGITETTTSNYPVTPLSLPSAEEVAAWEARTGAELMPA